MVTSKSPLEWFNAQWSTNSADMWKRWSENFLEAFYEKGWSDVWYASTYRWIPGTSYTEYVIKKNSLLVDSFPELNEKARIVLVVVGLPREVRDKLDRGNVKTQGNLLSEISKWENHSQSNFKNKKSGTYQRQNEGGEKGTKGETKGVYRNPEHRPCPICKKKGFKERYHHTKECWNNPENPVYQEKFNPNKYSASGITKGSGGTSEKPIKVANNTELEGLFNEIVNPKN